MKLAFAVVLVVHGLLHLLGVAKAFKLAELPEFSHPISRPMGLVWLSAMLLCVATALALYRSPTAWWWVGAVTLVASQWAIVSSWTDARAGTAVNVLILAAVVLGFAMQAPFSLRAEYQRAVEPEQPAAAPSATQSILRESDIASLPVPVQRYIRQSGAIGKPRVHSLRASFRGRIRSGPDDPWMTLSGEQHNSYRPMVRLFYLDARMRGIPVQVLHAYLGPHATMRVHAAGVLPLVTAAGVEMDRSETVTLFNDMCWLAPATLVNAAITWEPVDSLSARATFTNAGHVIGAMLTFNDAGELVNFVSDDRARASADGQSFAGAGWSTPLRAYRKYNGVRIASEGEAVWHVQDDSFTYIELELLSLEYNTKPTVDTGRE